MMLRFVTGVLRAHFPPELEIATARRAGEALLKIAAEKPDLVILDYGLPDLGGDAFCERLEGSVRRNRLPMPALVAMRSQGAGPRGEQTLDGGCASTTILKPFTPELLVATVRPLLAAAAVAQRREKPASDGAAAAPAATVALPPTPEGTRIRARLALPGKRAPFPTRNLTAKVTAARRSDDGATPASPPGGAAAALASATDGTREPFPVRAILQAVVAAQDTGVLHLFPSRRATSKPVEIYLHAGTIALVSTQESSAYAEGAVIPSSIPPDVLADAVRGQADSGCPFPLLLQLRGVLPEVDAKKLTHELGQRCVARLFTLPRPWLEFEALKSLPEYVPDRIARAEDPAALDNWLWQSLRRLQPQELPDLERDFPGAVPTLTPDGAETVTRLRLTAPEKEFAARVNGQDDLQRIADALKITPPAACSLLFRFQAIGCMEARPAAVSPPPSTSPADEPAPRKTRRLPGGAADTRKSGAPFDRSGGAPRLSGPWVEKSSDR